MLALRKYRFVIKVLLIILSTYICQCPPAVMKARTRQGQSKLCFPMDVNNISHYGNNPDSFSMHAAWLSVDSPWSRTPVVLAALLCTEVPLWPFSFKPQSQRFNKVKTPLGEHTPPHLSVTQFSSWNSIREENVIHHVWINGKSLLREQRNHLKWEMSSLICILALLGLLMEKNTN